MRCRGCSPKRVNAGAQRSGDPRLLARDFVDQWWESPCDACASPDLLADLLADAEEDAEEDVEEDLEEDLEDDLSADFDPCESASCVASAAFAAACAFSASSASSSAPATVKSIGPIPEWLAARCASTHATGSANSIVSAAALTTSFAGSGTNRIGMAMMRRISEG